MIKNLNWLRNESERTEFACEIFEHITTVHDVNKCFIYWIDLKDGNDCTDSNE